MEQTKVKEFIKSLRHSYNLLLQENECLKTAIFYLKIENLRLRERIKKLEGKK